MAKDLKMHISKTANCTWHCNYLPHHFYVYLCMYSIAYLISTSPKSCTELWKTSLGPAMHLACQTPPRLLDPAARFCQSREYSTAGDPRPGWFCPWTRRGWWLALCHWWLRQRCGVIEPSAERKARRNGKSEKERFRREARPTCYTPHQVSRCFRARESPSPGQITGVGHARWRSEIPASLGRVSPAGCPRCEPSVEPRLPYRRCAPRSGQGQSGLARRAKRSPVGRLWSDYERSRARWSWGRYHRWLLNQSVVQELGGCWARKSFCHWETVSDAEESYLLSKSWFLFAFQFDHRCRCVRQHESTPKRLSTLLAIWYFSN